MSANLTLAARLMNDSDLLQLSSYVVDGEQLKEDLSQSKSIMREDLITGEYVADHMKSTLVSTEGKCPEERDLSKNIDTKSKVGAE